MTASASSVNDPFTTESKRLLDPVDRISEILFGLLMAVTIVGSLSIAGAGRAEVRTVMFNPDISSRYTTVALGFDF